MKSENMSESDKVQEFLRDEKVVQGKYPVYSSDLSPCDFSFPQIEKDVSYMQLFIWNDKWKSRLSATRPDKGRT